MTDADKTKLLDIIAEKLSVDKEKLGDDTSFEDLGADSLDLVQVTMSIEEEFGLDEIDEDDAEKLKTIKDIVDYISSKQV